MYFLNPLITFLCIVHWGWTWRRSKYNYYITRVKSRKRIEMKLEAFSQILWHLGKAILIVILTMMSFSTPSISFSIQLILWSWKFSLFVETKRLTIMMKTLAYASFIMACQTCMFIHYTRRLWRWWQWQYVKRFDWHHYQPIPPHIGWLVDDVGTQSL